MRTTLILELSVDELRTLIAEAVAQALQDGPTAGPPLTAQQAARLVRRRYGDVLQALETGELPGRRNGKSWRIRREAVLAWAAGG